jgi:hypothetical protein
LGVEVVRADPDHIASIAERMRAADVAEVWAASGKSPSEALAFSLDRSDAAWTGIVDGQPEVMFGVGALSILSGVGAPWLLGTDEVERNRRRFLRGSIFWRDEMLKLFPVLRNVVDDRNAVSIRWLRWLGFTLSEPFPVGRERMPFRLFELRRPHV